MLPTEYLFVYMRPSSGASGRPGGAARSGWPRVRWRPWGKGRRETLGSPGLLVVFPGLVGQRVSGSVGQGSVRSVTAKPEDAPVTTVRPLVSRSGRLLPPEMVTG
jgi:hypothetical protein